MIKSIVVPLDGSPFGEQALPPALALARKTHVTIHLVQVMLPFGTMSPEMPVYADEALMRRLVDQERAAQQQYLDGIARRLSEAGAPRVQTWLVDGDVVGAIRRQVETLKADLVILSTHGRGAFARFWLGSVADQLVRSLPVPQMLVRPTSEEAPIDLENVECPRHILVGLDGSKLSEQILEPVANLAELAEADLTLVRIVRPVPPEYVEVAGLSLGEAVRTAQEQTERIHQKLRTDAQDYLTRLAGPLRERGLTVLTRVEIEDAPVPALLQHAQSADLMALATHGRKGLTRLFLGSVADKIIRGASVPVLVYRPKEK
jgi:nucleotide-binding universal stress UspA family protein